MLIELQEVENELASRGSTFFGGEKPGMVSIKKKHSKNIEVYPYFILNISDYLKTIGKNIKCLDHISVLFMN